LLGPLRTGPVHTSGCRWDHGDHGHVVLHNRHGAHNAWLHHHGRRTGTQIHLAVSKQTAALVRAAAGAREVLAQASLDELSCRSTLVATIVERLKRHVVVWGKGARHMRRGAHVGLGSSIQLGLTMGKAALVHVGALASGLEMTAQLGLEAGRIHLHGVEVLQIMRTVCKAARIAKGTVALLSKVSTQLCLVLGGVQGSMMDLCVVLHRLLDRGVAFHVELLLAINF